MTPAVKNLSIWRCAIKWFNCTKCKDVKKEDDFFNDRNRPSGKTAQCKLCMKQGLDKERRREYEKQYREMYPEKRAKILSAWYENNKDRHKAVRAAYLKTDGGHATYRKYTQKRYALRKAAFVEDVDMAEVYEEQRKLCYLCGSERKLTEMHADHVKPISRGGKHERKNVKMACAKCNLSKGAKEIQIALV